MNKNIIFILFIYLFYSWELQLPEEPSPPAWYLPITVPLIDTEYSFEGILQEGVINTTAESFEDCGSDANCDFIDEDGTQGNGLYDFGEVFIDENLFLFLLINLVVIIIFSNLEFIYWDNLSRVVLVFSRL